METPPVTGRFVKAKMGPRGERIGWEALDDLPPEVREELSDPQKLDEVVQSAPTESQQHVRAHLEQLRDGPSELGADCWTRGTATNPDCLNHGCELRGGWCESIVLSYKWHIWGCLCHGEYDPG